VAAKRKLRKGKKQAETKKKTPGTSCNVSLSGEHVKSHDITVSEDADGFFQENIKSIMESKRIVNDVITQICKE